MKIEIRTCAEAGAQVFLDGALVADIAIGEAITAAERDAELRHLRPLRVVADMFSRFLAVLRAASPDELRRICEGINDGARGALIPHPMDTSGIVPGIRKSYEHFYGVGYDFGQAFTGLSRAPVIMESAPQCRSRTRPAGD